MMVGGKQASMTPVSRGDMTTIMHMLPIMMMLWRRNCGTAMIKASCSWVRSASMRLVSSPTWRWLKNVMGISSR